MCIRDSRYFCNIVQGLFRQKRLMGCEEHIRHGNQPRQYVVLQNMSGIVLIKKLGFLFVYIEACGADLFVLDALRKGLRVDQAAARGRCV